MSRISMTTHLKPAEVLERARAFFVNDLHMTPGETSATSATFASAGQTLDISTCLDGKDTTVEFESSEMDDLVKRFVSRIRK